MSIDNILDGLKKSIEKLQELRAGLRSLEEKKELDGSIIRLEREYRELSENSEKYKFSNYQ